MNLIGYCHAHWQGASARHLCKKPLSVTWSLQKDIIHKQSHSCSNRLRSNNPKGLEFLFIIFYHCPSGIKKSNCHRSWFRRIIDWEQAWRFNRQDSGQVILGLKGNQLSARTYVVILPTILTTGNFCNKNSSSYHF